MDIFQEENIDCNFLVRAYQIYLKKPFIAYHYSIAIASQYDFNIPHACGGFTHSVHSFLNFAMVFIVLEGLNNVNG